MYGKILCFIIFVKTTNGQLGIGQPIQAPSQFQQPFQYPVGLLDPRAINPHDALYATLLRQATLEYAQLQGGANRGVIPQQRQQQQRLVQQPPQSLGGIPQQTLPNAFVVPQSEVRDNAPVVPNVTPPPLPTFPPIKEEGAPLDPFGGDPDPQPVAPVTPSTDPGANPFDQIATRGPPGSVQRPGGNRQQPNGGNVQRPLPTPAPTAFRPQKVTRPSVPSNGGRERNRFVDHGPRPNRVRARPRPIGRPRPLNQIGGTPFPLPEESFWLGTPPPLALVGGTPFPRAPKGSGGVRPSQLIQPPTRTGPGFATGPRGGFGNRPRFGISSRRGRLVKPPKLPGNRRRPIVEPDGGRNGFNRNKLILPRHRARPTGSGLDSGNKGRPTLPRHRGQKATATGGGFRPTLDGPFRTAK